MTTKYFDSSYVYALEDVAAERDRQDSTWGEQNHPDGTGDPWHKFEASKYRSLCDDAHARGQTTWRDIALEEFYEALAEEDPAKLRTELVQCAAVLVAWIEAIDRRGSTK